VKNHFQTVRIFDEYQIDFCCGGKQSLLEACENKSLNTKEIIGQLEEAFKIPALGLKFDDMTLTELIEYIKDKHHSYVREQIPLISKLLNKIEEVHGHLHPEIEMVNIHFKESVEQLSMHMKIEEELFPIIEQLESNNHNHSLNVEESISALIQDHEKEGSRFEEISTLTLGYQAPEGACRTYRAAYDNLQAFEKDLHRHVHLENNILFPKAIQLEKALKNN